MLDIVDREAAYNAKDFFGKTLPTAIATAGLSFGAIRSTQLDGTPPSRTNRNGAEAYMIHAIRSTERATAIVQVAAQTLANCTPETRQLLTTAYLTDSVRKPRIKDIAAELGMTPSMFYHHRTDALTEFAYRFENFRSLNKDYMVKSLLS